MDVEIHIYVDVQSLTRIRVSYVGYHHNAVFGDITVSLLLVVRSIVCTLSKNVAGNVAGT